ncbi:hypothetical protein VNI00_002220 [Paramarasmius palmivorus]|uniref:F-box domain-containing protein n=1 Tax=Paramarasmius palmivorus TaxID=297713 RepID=A0AAW0E3R1_9AGAR
MHDDVNSVEDFDRTIERVENALIWIKRERNSRLPVSRLPNEVLLEIFTYLTPKGPAIRSYFFTSGKMGWLSFTYVCQSWRTIALDHAPLWIYPDLSISGLAVAMIQRSKNATLHIIIPDDLDLRRDVAHTILNEISRVETFNMTVTDRSISNLRVLIGRLIQPAPRLRLLSFQIKTTQNIALPSEFFALDTPLLDTVSLHRCPVPWGSPMLKNVTSLRLSGNGGHIPSGQQFLETLRRMPSLQKLELSSMAPLSIEGEDVVHMPHLRRLVLSQGDTSCACVLEHVTFPSTTSVILRCQTSSDEDHFVPLWSALSKMYSWSQEGMTVLRVYADIDQYYELAIEGWKTGNASIPTHCTLSHCLGPSCLELYLTRSSYNARVLSQVDVARALRSVWSTSIEVVHIGGYLDLEDDDTDEDDNDPFPPEREDLFPIFFEELVWSTGLKRLTVAGRDWATRLAFALALPDDKGVPSDSPIPFPSLIDLSLSSIPTAGTTAIVDKLVKSLKWRMEHDRKLRSLSFRCCQGITEEQLESLRRVVMEVQQD